jgi:hypothetical protein
VSEHEQTKASIPPSTALASVSPQASGGWLFSWNVTLQCYASQELRLGSLRRRSAEKRATMIGSRTSHRNSGIMTGWWVADQGLAGFLQLTAQGKSPGASPHPRQTPLPPPGGGGRGGGGTTLLPPHDCPTPSPIRTDVRVPRHPIGLVAGPLGRRGNGSFLCLELAW